MFSATVVYLLSNPTQRSIKYQCKKKINNLLEPLEGAVIIPRSTNNGSDNDNDNDNDTNCVIIITLILHISYQRQTRDIHVTLNLTRLT